tara:strand:- start:1160 stop:2722 length:1563 start_codon:yes stop_codon:yes gene_type:complete
MAKKKDDLDDLVEKAKVLAEATGRDEADILADLMDDGILNDSHKETEKTDLVSQLKEAAELINTVQAINQEVSENKVLNGNGNSTNVEIDTTLEGDIVDRAIESVQRKAENIKKIIILVAPLFLLVGGGGSLEMFGVTDFVGDDEPDDYYPDDTFYEIWGCTDYEAENYDEYANMDDGSCSYPVYGCMNNAAPNYNPNATVEDGSCTRGGCTDPEAENYDDNANEDDGSCEYYVEPIYGCTDSEANNYQSEAEEDDGSCTYDPEPVYGCTDDSANNYNPEATEDDESCEYDPEPECEVEITNHYRGHVQSDTEQDAILIAFRIVPTDCDDEIIEVDIDMHPPGEDDEVDYHYYVTVNGSEPTDVSHTFDNVAVGVWVPRITAALDNEPIERIWMWSIEVEEQVCEINLFGINIGTNNTSAVVFYDLDCGTEPNTLEGYNVSVQFLVYSVNSTNNTNPPIEYNTTTHYIQGYADDPRMLRLSNFTDGNTTIYDFYWYVTWEDADGEVQYIERTWLNRELVA